MDSQPPGAGGPQELKTNRSLFPILVFASSHSRKSAERSRPNGSRQKLTVHRGTQIVSSPARVRSTRTRSAPSFRKCSTEGDYLPLDIMGIKLSKWLRQGSTVFLGAFIAFGADFHLVGSEGLAGISQPRINLVIFTEGVPVCDVPHKKHSASPVAESVDMLLFQGRAQFCAHNYGLVRPYIHNRDFVRRGWIADARERIREQPQAEMTFEIISGSLPRISQPNDSDRFRPKFNVSDAKLRDSAVGPQLPFGCSLGDKNECARSKNQQESKKTKDRLAAPYSEYVSFGSFVASAICLGIAFWVSCAGRFLIGAVIAFYSIFGLLFRIDLWSLWGML